MTTTLANCRVLLSKELGDYWASTSTSAGASDYTSIIDTALKAKADDWIGDDSYTLITESSDSSEDDERKIISLDNNTGAIITLAHTAQIASSTDYEIHRLFSASDKMRALVHAAKAGYPTIFIEVRDESLVSGNWLKDGSFEIWTSSSALTNWTTTTSTIAKTTSSPYYKHGVTSCKILTAAGSIEQSISNWDDLKRLAGKTVTFSIQGWCDTASCLRISIYDGVNTISYSSYHTGDSAWTQDEPNNDNMYVQATIDDNPTEITFEIHHDVAAGVSYVDDARTIAGSTYSPRIYIGDLGLVRNQPHQVLIEPANYSRQEPWTLIRNIRYDQTNGFMTLPSGVSQDYRLRILGNKYLDFYDTSDDVGTDWADTIAIDTPQTEILVAEAAVYLCNRMIVPNFTSGESGRWAQARAYWKDELRDRKSRFGMAAPSATVSWR